MWEQLPEIFPLASKTESCPLLVFVNTSVPCRERQREFHRRPHLGLFFFFFLPPSYSKSGGGQGFQLLRDLGRFLHPFQLYDITEMGPWPGWVDRDMCDSVYGCALLSVRSCFFFLLSFHFLFVD